jgi:tRNA pseudouridine38-40 synthase
MIESLFCGIQQKRKEENHMVNYRITIAYDGTRYKGWQSQKGQAQTIQGKLEAILEKMTGAPVDVHGSGRTDAGVHARAQVANFRVPKQFAAQEVQRYLNEYLPDDIAVTSIKKASDRFHARLNAQEKTYRYRILNSPVRNVFEQRYVWQYETPLEIEPMRKAAEYLVGTHDFQSFCAKKMKKSSVRTIFSLEIERVGEEIQIVVCGSGFLHHMVRIITGTLVEVGCGMRSPEEIPEILEAKSRESAGMLAPASGLIMESVRYDKA